MALIADQPGAEEKEDKVPQPGQTTGLGAPTGSGTGSKQTQGAAAAGPSSSGSFVDTGKYLEANRPAIGKVAGSIASNFADKGSGMRAEAQSQAQGYQDQIAANVRDASQFQGQKASQLVGQQAALDTLSGSYGGPRQEDITIDAGNNIGRLVDTAEQATSSLSGRKALLADVVGQGVKNYTSGERELDSLFLGQDRDAASTLQGSVQGLRDQASQIGDLQSNVRAQAAQAAQTNAAQAEALRNMIGSQLNTLTTQTGKDEMLRGNQIQNPVQEALVQEFQKMQREGTYQNLTEPQKEFFQRYYQQGEGSTTGLAGGLTGSAPASLGSLVSGGASELIRRFQDSGGQIGQGLTESQMAEAQAINQLLGDETSKELTSRGIYDEAATVQKIVDLFRNLGV